MFLNERSFVTPMLTVICIYPIMKHITITTYIHNYMLLIKGLQMLVTGIDIGSMSTKVVILNNNHLFNAISPTGWSPYRSEQIDYQIAVDFVNLVSCQANFVIDIGCTGQ